MNDILYMYINKYFSTNLNIFDLIPVVHAQSAVADKIVDNIINEIINPIIFVLFGLAMLVFIWGVITMFVKSGDAEAVGNGKKHMVWGIIGLAIMSGTFGIMNLICVFIGAC